MDGPRWAPGSGQPAQLLVVLCHGFGADGAQMQRVAIAWSQALPDAAFVAPHAPFPQEFGWREWLRRRATGQVGVGGRQWFSLARKTPPALERGVRQAAPLLDRFIDQELARLALAPDAYALAGFSQGAMVALHVGLRRPAAPRAILAYSGALLGIPSLAAERRNLAPVLLVHGERDAVVPPVRSRDAAQALIQVGVPVETVFDPALEHDLDAAGIAAGARFLQQRSGPGASGLTRT